jgi:Cu(I)/Ag(I) efflux system membrane fusion protein
MSAGRAAAVLAAVAAAGAGGFWAGGGRLPALPLELLSAVMPAEAAMAPAPAPDGPVIYWRDPDGAPV